MIKEKYSLPILLALECVEYIEVTSHRIVHYIMNLEAKVLDLLDCRAF